MNNPDTLLYTLITIILTGGALRIAYLLYKGKRESDEEEFEEQYHETMTRRDTLSGLTKFEERVLDIYVESNIKVPYEILEELRYMDLTDEEEIFAYIENQRLHWKLENSKKPYRKK